MGRPVYKRIKVEEKDLEGVVNALLADKWALLSEPEAEDQEPSEFFRKRIPTDDVLDTVNKMLGEGWENVLWEDDSDGEEWKGALVYATKYRPKTFVVVAMKSLSKTDEIELQREALKEAREELAALKAPAEPEEDEDAPAAE